ncbi:MAG TPA: hypothetical protein VGI57_14980, partial [Usitatibacter sp.]
DPDERLSDELKRNLMEIMAGDGNEALAMDRRLWMMGRPLPVTQPVTRAWCTGAARFTDVLVNEHPIVQGTVRHVSGEMEHHDSPDLEHWLDKQNRYTTAEAAMAYEAQPLGFEPRLLGNSMQRRMWLKRNFRRVPFRFTIFFLYHWLWMGAWRAGWVGYAWARLRADVMRLIEYKRREMELTGRAPVARVQGAGVPDQRVPQYE